MTDPSIEAHIAKQAVEALGETMWAARVVRERKVGDVLQLELQYPDGERWQLVTIADQLLSVVRMLDAGSGVPTVDPSTSPPGGGGSSPTDDPCGWRDRAGIL